MYHLLTAVVAIALVGAVTLISVSYAPVATLSAHASANLVVADAHKTEAGLTSYLISVFDGQDIALPASAGELLSALSPGFVHTPSAPAQLSWSYGLGVKDGLDSVYGCVNDFSSVAPELRRQVFLRAGREFGARATRGSACGDSIEVGSANEFSALTIWRAADHVVAEQRAKSWVPTDAGGVASGIPALAQPAMHECFTNPLGSTCTVNGVELYIASGSGSTNYPNSRVFLAMSDEPDAVPFFANGPDPLATYADYPVSGFHTVFQAWDPAYFSAADTWSSGQWSNFMKRTATGGLFAAGGTPMSWWQSQALVSALAADNRHPALAACARKSTGGLGWYLPDGNDLAALRSAGPGIDSIPNLKPGNVYRAYSVTTYSIPYAEPGIGLADRVASVRISTFQHSTLRTDSPAYMLGTGGVNVSLGATLYQNEPQYIRCAAILVPE